MGVLRELLFHELLRASSQLLPRDVEELPQRTLHTTKSAVYYLMTI